MTPFEPGGPQIPAAPLDIPTPDIPAADFVEIGSKISEGLGKGQLLDQWLKKLLDILAQAVGIIAAAIIGLIEWIIAKLLAIVIRSLSSNEAATNEIAALVVAGMTGQPVSSATFSDASNRGAREEVAVQLINTIQTALATGQRPAAAGGLQPSKEGAEAFLKLTSHMAIEGWLIGWISDAFSVHELEHLGDLKDTLERALGLGRLARRALAPPMKILVEDPYTWLLNDAYRPTLPAENVLVRQYLRGIIQRDELDKIAGYMGHSPANVEALINFNKAHLSPGDIDTLRLHGNLSDQVATDMLKAQGYDDATANTLQVALSQGRRDAWARTLVSEALSALTTRNITLDQFQEQLDGTGLPDDEKKIIQVVANLKVLASRKRFTLAEGTTLVKKGLWTLDQFRELATHLGYSSSDETDLELLLLVDIKDAADVAAKKQATAKAKAEAAAAKAAALKAKASEAAAAAEAKGIGLAKFEALVTDGLRTIGDYKIFLAGKGIAADNAAALVTVLQGKLDKAAASASALPGLRAGAKAKNLDLAQLDAAVKSGALSIAEYETRLQSIGFAPEDVALLAATLQDALDVAKVKADAKAAAAAKAKTKGVDLAQLERAVRIGLLDVGGYTARLGQMGFSADDSALLTGELEAQLTADATARATKAGVSGALKAKGLSLPQLEQSVRAGLASVDDYRAALAKAGYDSGSQDQLVSLLQLRMEQDQQTLAAKGHATALLAKTGLSLPDVERAVKLGVVPITTYTAALASSGVDAADAQVLTLSLAAQLKATKSAQAVVKAAAAHLKLVGIDLAALEQSVLNDPTSVPQFDAILSGNGISAADVATISQLLSEELANNAHVATLTGRVTASAAAKGLSLSQEEAAVKAGVKTLDDFSAFVAQLDYSAADVDTLVQTLAAKLKASPPNQPTPPPGG